MVAEVSYNQNRKCWKQRCFWIKPTNFAVFLPLAELWKWRLTIQYISSPPLWVVVCIPSGAVPGAVADMDCWRCSGKSSNGLWWPYWWENGEAEIFDGAGCGRECEHLLPLFKPCCCGEGDGEFMEAPPLVATIAAAPTGFIEVPENMFV